MKFAGLILLHKLLNVVFMSLFFAYVYYVLKNGNSDKYVLSRHYNSIHAEKNPVDSSTAWSKLFYENLAQVFLTNCLFFFSIIYV
jgi:hypothetical protein